MNRLLRRTIHIFYEEASMTGKRINSSEHFYIEYSFKRNARKDTHIIAYGKDMEKDFAREIRASIKRKNNHDSFYVVLDTDFDAGQSNIQHVISKIRDLHTKYRVAKIILSSRSFECWLCMYNRAIYTTPFTSQTNLNKDVNLSPTSAPYQKTKDWYQNHAGLLYSLYENAKQTNLQSRSIIFNSASTRLPAGLINHLNFPDFSNQTHINFLARLSPISYFDVLLDDIL